MTIKTHETSDFLLQPHDLLVYMLEAGWTTIQKQDNGWVMELPNLIAATRDGDEPIRMFLPRVDRNRATRAYMHLAIRLLADLADLPEYEFVARLVAGQTNKENDTLTEQRNQILGALAAFAVMGQHIDSTVPDQMAMPWGHTAKELRRAWAAWDLVVNQAGVKPPELVI